MSLERPEYSISSQQARINIAAAQEAIDYARSHGLKVLPNWLETIRRNEQVLGPTVLLNGTRAERSRSREPWRLPRSEEVSRARSCSEEVSRARSCSDGANRVIPTLQETGSGFEITLGGMVASTIEQEIVEAFWRFESREIETGGWLYALYQPDDQRISIAHASGPGRNGNHGPGRVRLSRPSVLEADFDDVLARARFIRVGDWHSHPARDPIPSDADLALWARNSSDAGVLPYASVIVTPEEVGWMTPTFSGYVIQAEEDEYLVCRPARISP